MNTGPPVTVSPMVAPKLLTLREIADVLGLKYRTVRNYHQMAERRRREDAAKPGDFPAPDDRVANVPVWKASTIRHWKTHRPGRGAGGGRPPKGVVVLPFGVAAAMLEGRDDD